MSNKSAIEVLYEGYLEGDTALGTKFDAKLRTVSETMDRKLENGQLTTSDLAYYEEAAVHAAFYAGFRAAMMAVMGV